MRLGIVFKPACRADVSRGCMPLPVECLYCSRAEGWYEVSFLSGEGASSASWAGAWAADIRQKSAIHVNLMSCMLRTTQLHQQWDLRSIAASVSKKPSCTDSLACLHTREHQRAHIKALRSVLKPIMIRRKGSAPEDQSQGSSPCCSLCCVRL